MQNRRHVLHCEAMGTGKGALPASLTASPLQQPSNVI
jgi:hypothetical protein